MYPKKDLKSAISFGFLLGITLVGAYLFIQFFGFNPFGGHGMLVYLSIALYIFYGVYYHKKFENGGSIGFLSAFKVSVLIGISGMIVCYLGLFLIAQFNVFEPSVVLEISEMKLELIKNESMLINEIGSLDYQQLLSRLQDISINQILIDELIKKSLVTLLISIIASVYFRT